MHWADCRGLDKTKKYDIQIMFVLDKDAMDMNVQSEAVFPRAFLFFFFFLPSLV